MWASVISQVLCKMIHSSLCRMLRFAVDVKGGVMNITWQCLFDFLGEHSVACFAWVSKCHLQKSFRLRASCMAVTAGPHIKACATTHAVHVREPQQTSTHISWETSCRLWASRMAATDVLAVAGADGGESCGDGLAALTPASQRKLRGERKKKKKADNLTAAAIHFSRPRRWDVTDVYMMQKLKSNPDGFSRVWEGRGEGINSSREIKSTCRLISVTSESTQESPFIILAGFCPATCQIVSPAPRIHLVSAIHSAEPWSNCILCMSVRLCDVSTSDKTVKLWKISERDKRPEGYNLKDEDGRIRDPSTITTLRVCETVECHNTHDVTYTAVKIGCD